MKTRKPISTISYNTPAFLELKLRELTRAKIISKWFYIKHQAESDEKKDHIHLYLEPAKQLQTLDLNDELIELADDGRAPLKCLDFRSSKFDDWYLYNLHDIAYLARKGQSREHHYKKDDYVVSDTDEFDYMVHEIDMTEVNAMGALIAAMNGGANFTEVVMRGLVPPQLFPQYKAAWDYLLYHRPVDRAGGESHTPAVDPATGELIEEVSDEQSDE